MSTTNAFSLTDAADILAPYVAREQRREEARAADHEAEAARARGVCHDGAADDVRPHTSRTFDEILDAAKWAEAKDREFKASPRGRFLVALRALSAVGYVAAAEAARSALSRGFARPDEPASQKELAFALKVLEPIDHDEARVACAALREIGEAV